MFADPKKIISQAFIGEGMLVADFGAGTGYYTIPLAQKVGEYGKVFALDVQADHLSKIKNEATRLGLKNVEIMHVDLEHETGSGLSQALVDRVIITNVLFQTDHPEFVVAEARRVLKRTGKIVIAEWADASNPIGPHAMHVIGKSKIVSMCRSAGLTLEKEIDAGSHHFGLLMKVA